MTMKGIKGIYEDLKPLIELCKIIAVLYLIFGVVFDVQNAFKGYNDSKVESRKNMDNLRLDISLISKYITTKENVDSLQNIRLANIEDGQKEIYDILKNRPYQVGHSSSSTPSNYGPSLTREEK
jgi:hypothetical protein